MSEQKIIEELKKSYWAEMETVMNYSAHVANLDGIRADVIKKSLAEDVGEELLHAQGLAKRIKEIGGFIPGSFDFEPSQKSLQPSSDTTDVIAVLTGVIDAENAAIHQYKKLIKLCDGIDYVTQDLCIRILGEEESHKVIFEGYLKECRKQGS